MNYVLCRYLENNPLEYGQVKMKVFADFLEKLEEEMSKAAAAVPAEVTK